MSTAKTTEQLLKDIWEVIIDILPIIMVAIFFQIIVLKRPFPDIAALSFGILLIIVGLFFFLRGLKLGVFPLGEGLAYQLVKRGNLFYILLFGFVITFSAVIVEPAVMAIAMKAEMVSGGVIDDISLRIIVAFAAGLSVAIGVLRSVLGHPIHWYLIPGYILISIATFFAPREIIALAYDSGGVTTSTITVPLVTAIGVGLVSSIRGRNPLTDGFGLVGFAVMTPILVVLGYGIIAFNSVDVSSIPAYVSTIVNESSVSATSGPVSIKDILIGFVMTIRDILPLAATILLFQLIILKQGIPNVMQIVKGFFFVLLGLYTFIHGLKLGLFPLGEYMAFYLIEADKFYWIYIFSFLIGFSCTIAEPAIIAVSKKIEEVTEGSINNWTLRIVVAMGVASGITIGAHRIITGDPIYIYVIASYLITIVLTLLAPRYIVPIAYDTGGATTSTVTVPLVTALGIGLASNISGRDPFMDGFGLIAFASICPLITVMGYGTLSQYFLKKGGRKR
ncbi:DUF1538 domain-containing protein [Thermodesulfovibrionales bacterium]|nr:DUF1538 domain-containing protein [Thermodesulfovibrionales bacterium]